METLTNVNEQIKTVGIIRRWQIGICSPTKINAEDKLIQRQKDVLNILITST